MNLLNKTKEEINESKESLQNLIINGLDKKGVFKEYKQEIKNFLLNFTKK